MLACWLSIPKIVGSNHGISGWKEEMLGNVVVLKRTHQVETDFTDIEGFPIAYSQGPPLPRSKRRSYRRTL